MFSSTSFIILALAPRPLVHSVLILYVGWGEVRVQLYSSACGYPVVPLPVLTVWEKIPANDATNKVLILKYTNGSYSSKKKKKSKNKQKV